MSTRNHFPLTLVVIMIAAFGSGCATVTAGTSAQVTFHSVPEGAKVQVETTKQGKYYTTTTPGTLKLPKKSSYLVQYEKEGFHTVTAAVDRKIGRATAGSLVGNALIGGVIGATVDTITGANMNLPKEVRVEMTPVAETAPANAGTISEWRGALDQGPLKQADTAEGSPRRENRAPRKPIRRR